MRREQVNHHVRATMHEMSASVSRDIPRSELRLEACSMAPCRLRALLGRLACLQVELCGYSITRGKRSALINTERGGLLRKRVDHAGGLRRANGRRVDVRTCGRVIDG